MVSSNKLLPIKYQQDIISAISLNMISKDLEQC
ncbi:MAG: hypothetical protein ACI90A_000589 [Shewanella sp.]|jgi:hypothetical protein